MSPDRSVIPSPGQSYSEPLQVLDPASIPDDWDSLPPSESTQEIGSK